MKVCIVGAGAIGGFIGTRLALAGRAQVSAIARGATLAALREHGWRLQQGAELVRSSARAVERASESATRCARSLCPPAGSPTMRPWPTLWSTSPGSGDAHPAWTTQPTT